jgi:PPOX class probable F420-dependent enzyme
MNTKEKKNNNNNIITEEVANFFRGKNFAFLGTLNNDGSPQVTPTWIELEKDNGIILINTAEGRIKQKNVTRDPRVSISMIDENNPYSMVTIKGRVVDQTTSGADEHIDKLARRYLNAERYPSHSPNIKRIVLKIKPEKAFYLPPRYREYMQKNK